MSQIEQIDELGSPYQRPADAAVGKAVGRRTIDWAVLVVTFALGCTLAWIYVVFRAAVYALQIALS
jgi:preprotein translocase subunit SecF